MAVQPRSWRSGTWRAVRLPLRAVGGGRLAGPAAGRLHRRLGRCGRERGAATVEIAVLFPAFLLLIFGGVQAAEWYHVRNLCLHAADAGVQAGRVRGATAADAQHAAAEFLTEAGSGTAGDPAISTAGSTAVVVRVEVSASVPRLLPLPGLSVRVTQFAQAPREVFTVDSRGFTNSEAGSGGN